MAGESAGGGGGAPVSQHGEVLRRHEVFPAGQRVRTVYRQRQAPASVILSYLIQYLASIQRLSPRFPAIYKNHN